MTVILPQPEIEALWSAIESNPETEIEVDLDQREVRYSGKSIKFDLDDYTRWRLMEGLDDIGLTLRNIEAVENFEKLRANFKPKTLPILS